MPSPKDHKRTIVTVSKPEAAGTDDTSNTDSKPAAPTAATTNAPPLGPPPRPQNTTGDTPDYFNTVHNPFSLEPNVFEASFGNPSIETPGKTILPPVANITSPSGLPGITPGWQSLRSGPLSPAMLTGPTGETDYFSGSFRGFPTPNESSLRTGLTPGGGGSMFPVPSPSTQAIFNLQSGGVTPSTAEFQQSALRAAQQAHKYPTTSAPTSQPDTVSAGMERPSNTLPLPQQPPVTRGGGGGGGGDYFSNHTDVSTAANDLLSFAQQNGGSRNGSSFPVTSQPPPQTNSMGGHAPVQPPMHDQSRRNTKGSINSIPSVDTVDFSDSGHSEQMKSSTRTRGNAKKGGAATKQAAGTRRKATTPQKTNTKKTKGNNGSARSMSMEGDGEGDGDSDEETSPKPEQNGENGKKMTDEEKRKNFLERNRVAALKCRQRKKQWLQNLQQKVELFSTENDALSATVTGLREEIVNLKTLLLAHKDCPVSQAQGLAGVQMHNFLGGDIAHHQNPYGMAMAGPNGVPMMAMQGGAPMNQTMTQSQRYAVHGPFPQ
ncbi:hypothetical protein GQ43DRAFT_451836 [Delitschia confertaspora ATCC 74209]|uniref:BZIP domain-containing protein n=1 Tax=Delitschia confertaspora ATCC 74209 TaxID=1513339 RepID=A0A9P4JDN6_9PLEO|nr:hypothetical protein GQ43DRAFT_451836 [Delitschia confertaspora ATCC 74209]